MPRVGGTYTDELGQWTKFAFDAAGNMTTMTDYQGFITSTTFDRLDRPATLRDPRNGLTSFRYDAAGNLTSLTDAALNTTMFEYDRLDRRTANTNQLGGRRTFAYDAARAASSLTCVLVDGLAANLLGWRTRAPWRGSSVSAPEPRTSGQDYFRRRISTDLRLPRHRKTNEPAGERLFAGGLGISLRGGRPQRLDYQGPRI